MISKRAGILGDFPEIGECKSLMVMDMQPGFLRNKRIDQNDCRILVTNIAALVSLFRELSKEVIIVEYHDEGDTVAEIKNVLDGYGKTVFMVKTNFSDSVTEDEPNAAYLESSDVFPMFATGVNTPCCIADSLADMKSLRSDARFYMSGSTTRDYSTSMYSTNDALKVVRAMAHKKVKVLDLPDVTLA